MYFDRKDIDQTRQLIDAARRVVVFAHVGPDGDALGSSLGCYHLFRALGKSTAVIFPNAFARNLAWMPGATEALLYKHDADKAQKAIQEADLLFICDLNELTRLNTGAKTDGLVGLGQLVHLRAIPKVLIDHHERPQTDQFDVLFSRPELSSASEVAYRLFSDLQLLDTIPFEGFQCLLTGMMTDTGFFHYSCQYPEFFHIVADMVGRGVNIPAISQNITAHEREEKMRMVAYLIEHKMEILPECATAVTVLTDDEKRRFHYETGDLEGYVNMPLNIEGINRSIFIREERQDGIVKLSFRSQGDVNVEQLARRHFNGGGHFNAAGGEVRDLSVNQTHDKLLQILKNEHEK